VSQNYEETLCGELLVRRAPGQRHEIICGRLHQWVRAGTSNLASTHLLAPRTQVRLSFETVVCPDLALVTVATGKLWLAAEIVSSDDHRPDTVIKKQIYEESKLPRLWMIDPRYDNVEVYHAAKYGLILKAILAGREILSEKLLPEFQLTVAELFQTPEANSREANIVD
jgi:Uma2 family endonuclease